MGHLSQLIICYSVIYSPYLQQSLWNTSNLYSSSAHSFGSYEAARQWLPPFCNCAIMIRHCWLFICKFNHVVPLTPPHHWWTGFSFKNQLNLTSYLSNENFLISIDLPRTDMKLIPQIPWILFGDEIYGVKFLKLLLSNVGMGWFTFTDASVLWRERKKLHMLPFAVLPPIQKCRISSF